MSSPQVSTQQQWDHGSKNSSTRTWEHKWLSHPSEKKQMTSLTIFSMDLLSKGGLWSTIKDAWKNSWHPPSCSLQIKTESKKNCFSISSSYNAIMNYPFIAFFWVG
jgi:hypothetical protein